MHPIRRSKWWRDAKQKNIGGLLLGCVGTCAWPLSHATLPRPVQPWRDHRPLGGPRRTLGFVAEHELQLMELVGLRVVLINAEHGQ